MARGPGGQPHLGSMPPPPLGGLLAWNLTAMVHSGLSSAPAPASLGAVNRSPPGVREGVGVRGGVGAQRSPFSRRPAARAAPAGLPPRPPRGPARRGTPSGCPGDRPPPPHTHTPPHTAHCPVQALAALRSGFSIPPSASCRPRPEASQARPPGRPGRDHWPRSEQSCYSMGFSIRETSTC